MQNIDVKIAEGLATAAADVAAAWKAAEAGHTQALTDRIYFRDWAALCAVLTPKRYMLLRHLRQTPEPGVRALARALGRDVKRVHTDVVSLAELGLIDRDAATGGLSTPVDEIASIIRIAA